MESVTVDGGTLVAQSEGSGQPLLLIHGAFIADAFAGITRADGIRDAFQTISYHRRGFEGSSPVGEGFSVQEQAADAVAVLDQFGVSQAHIVGHSYGGAVALQLALDAPERVATLSLLEAPIMLVPAAAEFVQGVEAVGAIWGEGNKAAATDALMQAVGGADYRAAVEGTAPAGWFDAATSAVDAWFLAEAPSLGTWGFGPDEAGRVAQPCLLVAGEESADFFGQSVEWQGEHIPGAESVRIAGATHLLQLQKPEAIAPVIASFTTKHPIG